MSHIKLKSTEVKDFLKHIISNNQDLQKEGIGLDELKFKVPPTKEQILENLDQQNSFTSKDKSTLQMFILSEQQQLGPLFHGQ